MRDAFDDLRAHQLGVMAGMRAALEGVLQRFDPAQLEGKLTRRSGIGSLLVLRALVTGEGVTAGLADGVPADAAPGDAAATPDAAADGDPDPHPDPEADSQANGRSDRDR